MLHSCQSLQHSCILPQKEGWGCGGGKGGREMEQGSCFFNKLQQKASQFPHYFFHTPAERGRRRQHESLMLPRRIKLAPYLPNSHTIDQGSLPFPWEHGDTSQKACLLPWMLTPVLMTPKRLQPPPYPSSRNLSPHHPPTSVCPSLRYTAAM